MKIVVDTNIVFSAMLNPSATIGQVIIYGHRHHRYQFFAPYLLREEIRKHENRILSLSKSFDNQIFEDIRDEIFRCINFISEEQIPYDYWHKAIPLVRDTDMDDIAFVVLADYLDAKLWTGDKKLPAGLEKNGFERMVTTEDLFKINFFDPS